MLLLLLQVLTQELEFLQITPSRHGPITLVSAPGQPGACLRTLHPGQCPRTLNPNELLRRAVSE